MQNRHYFNKIPYLLPISDSSCLNICCLKLWHWIKKWRNTCKTLWRCHCSVPTMIPRAGWVLKGLNLRVCHPWACSATPVWHYRDRSGHLHSRLALPPRPVRGLGGDIAPRKLQGEEKEPSRDLSSSLQPLGGDLGSEWGGRLVLPLRTCLMDFHGALPTGRDPASLVSPQPGPWKGFTPQNWIFILSVTTFSLRLQLLCFSFS